PYSSAILCNLRRHGFCLCSAPELGDSLQSQDRRYVSEQPIAQRERCRAAAAPQIEQALHANLIYRSRKDGSSFVTVDREPSIDLTVPILHISGLGDI